MNSSRLDHHINIHQQAAEHYRFQPDQSVIYFFNPFSIKVFKIVIEHLLDSLRQHPREVDILLYYPDVTYSNYLQKETLFQQIDSVDIYTHEDSRERIDIYRYLPLD